MHNACLLHFCCLQLTGNDGFRRIQFSKCGSLCPETLDSSSNKAFAPIQHDSHDNANENAADDDFPQRQCGELLQVDVQEIEVQHLEQVDMERRLAEVFHAARNPTGLPASSVCQPGVRGKEHVEDRTGVQRGDPRGAHPNPAR